LPIRTDLSVSASAGEQTTLDLTPADAGGSPAEFPARLIDPVGANAIRAPKHGIDVIQRENLGWFVAHFLYYYSRWENHV